MIEPLNINLVNALVQLQPNIPLQLMNEINEDTYDYKQISEFVVKRSKL